MRLWRNIIQRCIQFHVHFSICHKGGILKGVAQRFSRHEIRFDSLQQILLHQLHRRFVGQEDGGKKSVRSVMQQVPSILTVLIHPFTRQTIETCPSLSGSTALMIV